MLLRSFTFAGLLVATPVLAKVPTKRPPEKVRGRTLYKENCVACHGAVGKGDGPIAPILRSTPGPVLRVYNGQDQHTAVELIQEGRGEMPAFSQIFDRYDAKRILTWLSAVAEGEDPDQAVDPGDRPKKPAPRTDLKKTKAAAEAHGDHEEPKGPRRQESKDHEPKDHEEPKPEDSP